MRQLPDVNVLLALLWPRLESHAAAHAWFAQSGSRGWATNPLTQLGTLRLLTNPAITHGALTSSAALHILAQLTSHKGHEFWPLDGDFSAVLASFAAKLKGHQQWTDAALLWHARRRGGVLVTFDAGMKQLATGECANHLRVLRVQ
jgi:hypothetical protein